MQPNVSSKTDTIVPVAPKNSGQIGENLNDSVKSKAEARKGLKRGVKEKSYLLALLLVDLIDTDLEQGTRHYRTRAGQLLTTLDQVVRAALDRDLLITVPADTTFYVPPSFARCPYCDGRLYAGFRGWSQEPDGTWIGDEVELDCENEPDMEEDEEKWEAWLESHSEMPYVYWLPVCERVKQWVNSQYRFMKGEFERPERKKAGQNDL